MEKLIAQKLFKTFVSKLDIPEAGKMRIAEMEPEKVVHVMAKTLANLDDHKDKVEIVSKVLQCRNVNVEKLHQFTKVLARHSLYALPNLTTPNGKLKTLIESTSCE